MAIRSLVMCYLIEWIYLIDILRKHTALNNMIKIIQNKKRCKTESPLMRRCGKLEKIKYLLGVALEKTDRGSIYYVFGNIDRKSS